MGRAVGKRGGAPGSRGERRSPPPLRLFPPRGFQLVCSNFAGGRKRSLWKVGPAAARDEAGRRGDAEGEKVWEENTEQRGRGGRGREGEWPVAVVDFNRPLDNNK